MRFPELVELLGPFPNPKLQAERTDSAESSIAWSPGTGTRLRATVYVRRASHIAYSEQTEWRLVGERTFGPLYGAPLRDTLRGHARGFELVVERRGANRISG